MHIFFLLLLVICLMVSAVFDARKVKELLHNPITENIRCKWYNYTIIWGWAAVVVVVILCWFAGVSPADIGLQPISVNDSMWFSIITFVLSGAFSVVCLYQVISYLVSEKYRQAVKEKLVNGGRKNHYDTVISELMIPRSKREKGLFFWVSLTAGIGEEIILRGLLFFLLRAVFPGLSIILVVIIASAIFGIGHIYQGLSGAIKTTIIGALFGCLFIASGSLIPGILMHFFVDFSSAFLLSQE